MGLEKEATNNKDNNVVKLKVNTKRPEIITSQHHIDHDHDHDHDDQVKHADDEQVVVDVQYQYLPFVCPVCNQRFKSGQALGGHKRIHRINNKINNKRKDIDIDNQDHDDEIIGNSSISTQDDHMINIIIGDGTDSNSTFVKTPKRQRNLMLSSSSHKTTPPSDHLAAIALMLLAHHDHCVSVTPTAEEEEEEAEEEEYICGDCNISFPTDHISTHNKKNINIDKPLTRSIDSLRSVDHERAATHDTNGDDGGKDIDVPHPKGSGSRRIVFDFDLNELPPSED